MMGWARGNTNKELEVHPKGDVNRSLNRIAASVVLDVVGLW